MARWKKVVWSVVAVVVLVVVGAVQAVVGWRALLFGPRARALTSRTFEATPARLERGRYLAEARHGCVFCHSERDWSAPGAPPRADRLGAGVVWTAEGMPWLTAPNLTPDPETGLGRVSDDAIARAIREGIGLDGRALFALMPYGEFRRIPDEDVAAIVVYLRSLPPVRNPLPKTALPFPLGVIMRGVPEPLEGAVPAPDLSTPEKRGEYVLRTSACHHCHTPMKRGQPDADPRHGGWKRVRVARGPGVRHQPHARPHRHRALRRGHLRPGHAHGQARDPAPGDAVGDDSRMTDEDLGALYAYLRTLKPVAHVVTNGVEPTDCVVCGLKHGGGDRNGT